MSSSPYHGEGGNVNTFLYSANVMDNEGRVYCPKCGKVIDPNDESNVSYKVLEAIVNRRNELTHVIVQCHCSREIIIVLK